MINALKEVNNLLKEEISLAKEGDWDALLIKEHRRNQLVMQLDKQSHAKIDYSAEDQNIISNLLADVNSLEKELLDTTELAQIENRNALKNTQQQSKVAKTYGSTTV